MSDDSIRLAHEAVDFLSSRFGLDRIDLALVLGSGWSAGADQLGERLGEIELGDVPGFSPPVVSGHGGVLRLIRTMPGKTAAVLTGRTPRRRVGSHGPAGAAGSGVQSSRIQPDAFHVIELHVMFLG